ncbi:hypothetical protein TL16_g10864 [Triparma laevis f. inornata]|uniref:PH domain-containing protein n=1 Tax=Triparma laevis f. inornata TaxID=1714386 RepID=A0A9W7BBN4_9STRA|nr:hypothetical protein TL16_g10864 [Triparma laevis f. inornata]
MSLFLLYSWLVPITVRVLFNTCNFMQVHVHAADDTLTIDARDVEEEGQDYSLSSCILRKLSATEEEQQGRNYMFSVESVMRKTTLTFAAENQIELNKWLKFLAKGCVRTYMPSGDTKTEVPNRRGSISKMRITTQHQPDIVVDPVGVGDDEWNDRYQKAMLMNEETLENSVQKGLTISSLAGSFLSAATNISQKIVYEYALPDEMQSVKKLDLTDDNGNKSSEELFYHQGMLFRLSQQPVQEHDIDPSDERRRTLAVGDTIQHKVAGHELRCIRWAQQAATAVFRSQMEMTNGTPYPVCTPMSCITDISGFRFFILAVPPVDDEMTLSYGRLSPVSPFVMNDEELREQLKLICRMMNLKVHEIDVGNGETERIPAGCDFQAHNCADNRGYLMNLGKAAPPDLPLPETNQILTNQLRPEFIQGYNKPLSSDSFRVEIQHMDDSIHNDEECVDASVHLRTHTIPQFVAALDALAITPNDSASFTKAMHQRGINMRYLGYIYDMTSLPHIKSLVLAEAAARTAKHVLNQAARSLSRKAKVEMHQAKERGKSRDENFLEHNEKLRNSLSTRLIDFLNLILGMSDESDAFWERMMLPLLDSKYSLNLELPKRRYVAVHMPQLLHSISFHCSVTVADKVDFDFSSRDPISSQDVKSFDSKVKWEPNDQVEAFSIAEKGEEFLEIGEYARGLQALNLELSMHTATFGFAADQSRTASIMNNIAFAHYKCEQYKQSVEVANKVLSAVPASSMLAAEANSVLMKSFFKLRGHDASAKAFNLAKKSSTWAVGNSHPFLLEILSSLADLFYEEKDYESATMYCQRALAQAKKVLGSKHSVVAHLSSKIGILLATRGDAKTAIVTLKGAIDLFEKYAGNEDMSLNQAAMFFSLAEVEAQGGKMEDAMQLAIKALRVRVQLRSKGHQDVIESYIQVARIFENMEHIEDAVTNYEKALNSLKKIKGDEKSARMVQLLTRKVLSLEVRNQTLSMKTFLQTKMLDHPALIPGSQASHELQSYVLKLLYITSPSEYLKQLLEYVSAVNGDESGLPQLPSDQGFTGVPPTPAAQLACLASLAKEAENNKAATEDMAKKKEEILAQTSGGGGEMSDLF